MIKKGNLKVFNNLVLGWFSQGIHSLDKGERAFRVSLELFIIICLVVSFKIFFRDLSLLNITFLIFLVIHSLFYIFDGTFWVYMILSFNKLKNPGILPLLTFAVKVKFMLYKFCELIIIYGSISRGEFHKRSDLDMMAVRKKGLRGFFSLWMAIIVRGYAFLQGIPLSLYILDTIDELPKRVRKDEKPIIVYNNLNLLNFEPNIYSLDDLIILYKEESFK